MKKLGLSALVSLALALAGCLPVASLETAAPVEGGRFTAGLTAVAASDASDLKAGALPYLAYAWGDGKTEFSISGQIGLRAGIKQMVAESFSVAGGVTIPWLILSGKWGSGIPFNADVALLYDAGESLTLMLRGMYAYLSADLGHAWIGGTNLTYSYDALLFEGGVLLTQSGSPVISLSGAYRF